MGNAEYMGPEYTLSEIEIPTVAEVDHWAKELAKIPATGAYDVSEAVDYGIRFSLLTFRRSTNDAVTMTPWWRSRRRSSATRTTRTAS